MNSHDSVLPTLRERFGDVEPHGTSGYYHRVFMNPRPDRSRWEIRFSIAGGTEAADALLAEISLIRSLRHRHIVAVIDHGDVDGLPYYVVEEGTALFEQLGFEGTLPIPEVAALLVQLASAFVYCHGRDVIHSSVSPLHVRFHGPRAVLDGFAMAALPRRLSSLEGVALGNPTYLSPEVCRGEPADVRSDIYGLGAVAYLCLEGSPAHEGATGKEFVDRKGTQPPRLSRAVVRTAPELSRLVEAMLAPESSDRPQTAQAVHDTLLHLSGSS